MSENVFNAQPEVNIMETPDQSEGGQGESVNTPADNTENVPEVNTETPPIIEEGGQGAITKAEWENNYNSPEEMYAELQKSKTAYDNLRPEYTRTTQELQSMRKTLDDMKAIENIEDISKLPEDQRKILDAVMRNVNAQLQPITEKQGELEMDKVVSNMKNRHDDFDGYSNEIQEVLKDNKYLWQGGIEKALESAYSIVKGQNVDKNVDELVAKKLANNKANMETKTNIDASENKRATSVNNGTKSSPADEIANGIVNARKNSGTVFGS